MMMTMMTMAMMIAYNDFFDNIFMACLVLIQRGDNEDQDDYDQDDRDQDDNWLCWC